MGYFLPRRFLLKILIPNQRGECSVTVSRLNQFYIPAFSSDSIGSYKQQLVLIDNTSHAIRMLMSYCNSLASQFSTPSWLHNFFVMMSLAISALSCSSAYIFSRHWFSSSSSFIRFISDVSMPPNLVRYLYTLAELMSCSRHNSGTVMPVSFSFKLAIIWLSVSLDFSCRSPSFSVRENPT